MFERVVLYDADHHPDASSLLIASAHMELQRADVVQGSTYLRERPCPCGPYVNAEFFVTHFVFFPALEWLTGTASFGGS